jgi:hypothetical protein
VRAPAYGPSEYLSSSVEVIADGDAPQLAPVLGSFQVPSTAALYAFGDRLVTLDVDPSTGTRLDVYDLRDPSAPRPEGNVTVPELSWHLQEAVDPRCVAVARSVMCWRTRWPDAVALPNALVFVTPGFDTAGAKQVPTFYVVNLTDPAAPALSGVVRVPCDETPSGVFREGTDLYYVSAHLVPVSGQRFPNAAYFMRRIDLHDPTAPVLGDPVNVPGQPFAASDGGADFYSVEHAFVSDEGAVSGKLQRFRIENGDAQVVATRDMSGSELTGIARHGDGRIVFFDWGTTPQTGSLAGAITVAASDTLEILGKSPERVQWRGAQCEDNGNVALERVFEVAAVDTRAGGNLAVHAGYAGPTYGFANQVRLRSLACDDRSLVWASGVYGMGAVGLGP